MLEFRKFPSKRQTASFAVFLTILAYFEISVSSASAFGNQVNLCSLLPSAEKLKGWKAEGAAQVFEGEELFISINGGAEIYLEYGFRQVLVQDYGDDQGHRLSLEIFEMASPESAFGIFSFKRSASGEAIDIGDEAQVADYYLNLWKGNFLVTVTGMDDDAKTREGLFQLASLVAERIPDSQPKPALLCLFPEEGLLPQTIKFFKGHLGLFNTYPFFATDVFRAEKAARAEYLTGESVFLFKYPDDSSSEPRLRRIKEAFFKSDRYSDFVDDGDIFWVRDRQGRSVCGAARKNVLVLVVSSKDSRTVRKMLELVEQKISRQP